MGVVAIQPSSTGFIPNTTGLGLNIAQQLPTFILIETNNTLAQVLTTGFLTESKQAFGFAYTNQQVALVYTTDSGSVWLQVQVTGTAPAYVYSLVGTTNVSTIFEAAVGSAAAPSYTFVGRTNTGMYSSAANTLDFSTDGTRQVEVGGAIVAVNYLQLKGSVASSPVVIASNGTDSAVNIQLFPKGTSSGQVVFPVGALATPAITILGDLTTGIYSGGSHALNFATNGQLSFQIANTASTVNYLIASGNATNAANAALQPTLNATGTDTNIDVGAVGKGTGGFAVLPSTTAAAGNLKLWNGAGNFFGKLVFAALGQSTTLTMNDIGAATGGIPVATTSFIMKSVAQAAVAGGNAAQTVTDTFCTTGSNVIGNWNDTTNAVTIQKIAAGNGSFVVTSSGDPGSSHLNYIITK